MIPLLISHPFGDLPSSYLLFEDPTPYLVEIHEEDDNTANEIAIILGGHEIQIYEYLLCETDLPNTTPIGYVNNKKDNSPRALIWNRTSINFPFSRRNKKNLKEDQSRELLLALFVMKFVYS